VFQNEPLGLAKNLVDMIDEHQDVDDRYYLFVSPGPRLSTRSNGFNEANASLKATLLAIVEAIFNQARFHDWITAERVNDQIRVFNMRAEQLQQQMLSRAVNEAALLPAISALLPLLLAPDEQRAAELRLQQQFAAEYATLAAVSPTAGDTWIRAILVLEAAADLGARDEMNILGVTAEPSELASSAVVAFAGFIDRRYRLHDYDVGRRKAQAELTSAACPLGVLRYTPKPINPIDHSLDGLTLDTMDPRARQALADRLVDRADELLQEFGLNGALRWGIKQFFVKKEIAKLVGLGDAPSAPPDPNEAP